jgi:hypothetical protein
MRLDRGRCRSPKSDEISNGFSKDNDLKNKTTTTFNFFFVDICDNITLRDWQQQQDMFQRTIYQSPYKPPQRQNHNDDEKEMEGTCMKILWSIFGPLIDKIEWNKFMSL